jgi:hypothetical protein
MTQCRWCEHDETQHDIDSSLGEPFAFPCRVSGCDCDDYEEEDEEP